MATTQFMRVKGKATNSYAGTTGLDWGCLEAAGQQGHSLQRPREEWGAREG